MNDRQVFMVTLEKSYYDYDLSVLQILKKMLIPPKHDSGFFLTYKVIIIFTNKIRESVFLIK